MGTVDKRKIKEVKGFKVNHPYSAGNIFYTILILLVVALPVAFFFIPLASIGVEPNVYSITGLDLVSYTIDFVKTKAIPPHEFFDALYASINLDALKTPSFYIVLGSIGLMALTILMSVIGFIYFMVSIVKGYLRHPGHVKTLIVFDFIFTLLFSLCYLTLLFFSDKAQNYVMWLSFVPVGISFVLLITLSIALSANYTNVVYEADLIIKEDEESEVVTHVTQVHEITKVNYEASNELPPNLESIGGSAFAENQNIEIANIPLGIDKLGPSAFANCLKLKVVSIPESVKEIGYNCFFNCAALERINYAGTKEQWRHVKRGSNWLAKAKTTKVICTDGPIIVHPYH